MYTTNVLLAATGLLTGSSALNIPRAQSPASPSVRYTSAAANPAPAAVTTITSGVTYDGCTYSVAGTGKFTERAVYNFASGSSLPSGLYPSDYTVYDSQSGPAPYNHRFQPKNVNVANGYMNLLVPGGQKPASDPDKAINSAEVGTTRSDILYASVRTKAIFSDVIGTCHGNFFYYSDNAEIDIEYLTDPASQSNTGSRPNPLWYTNQPASANSPITATQGPGLANVTTALNEYRIDWVKGQTKFFLNGKQQVSYTQNVPTTAGSWIWNNWSNGDKGWSVGPPASNNVFRISSIDMYFNTTSSASKSCSK